MLSLEAITYIYIYCIYAGILYDGSSTVVAVTLHYKEIKDAVQLAHLYISVSRVLMIVDKINNLIAEI